ncbi:hypothetical protein B0H14DRAFT_2679495 [Mycena olivaceomarginata]|nr:hypothetical protein B0H14DRAFT_2679495 [Mycena olivaceomarginata]
MQSKPPLFHTSVRQLSLRIVQAKHLEFLLTHCHRVENLFLEHLSTSLGQLGLIGNPPLKRFHCHLASLFHGVMQLDFTHRVFPHITHLQLFDGLKFESADVWRGLALIPHLTYLSFFNSHFNFRLIPLFRDPLGCKFHMRGHMTRFVEIGDDSRVVCMHASMDFADNWYVGAHGAADFWSRAEKFISQGRSGKIPPTRRQRTRRRRDIAATGLAEVETFAALLEAFTPDWRSGACIRGFHAAWTCRGKCPGARS